MATNTPHNAAEPDHRVTDPVTDGGLASMEARFAGQVHNVCLKLGVDEDTASELALSLVSDGVLADDTAAIADALDRFDVPHDARVAALAVVEERTMSRGELAAISNELTRGDAVR
ncbi:hypothetical protein, partial [Haloferax sulfurifontis]